ncbi:MAG TPA: GNAT family N-acetyltransferase [Gemmatimonadales bacterium]|nr:GNAT family N-acetyltransferase [Gemmatimonadales bacterium]
MPRPERLLGPRAAQPADVDRINRVFSEAFTDRYQRDGMSGVRVPLLNPVIWRFAIAVADEGALVWHDPAGEIVAFNLVHHSGSEGWMGPLAVRPGRQGEGIGALIVRTGIARLEAAGARVIGIETMPRTVDNIGFYSRLGFRPGHLTVSLARELGGTREQAGQLLSQENADPAFKACRSLTDSLIPGVDFSRELALTLERGLGDATLLREHGDLAAFALWHSAPLAEGRAPDEIRVLKLVAKDLGALRRLLVALEASAVHARGRRIAIRCQTAYRAAYGALLDAGYRVHWTDLRMTLDGRGEELAKEGGVLFSNWEI